MREKCRRDQDSKWRAEEPLQDSLVDTELPFCQEDRCWEGDQFPLRLGFVTIFFKGTALSCGSDPPFCSHPKPTEFGFPWVPDAGC